jgi:flagellar biogenesis protein FliO
MSPLLRSLLFLPLGSLLLTVTPLCAQAPPPLPRPPQQNTNNATLDNLRAMSGPKAAPPQSIRTTRQDTQMSEHLVPPRPMNRIDSPAAIGQASFTTSPISSVVSPASEESMNERTPTDSFTNDEYEDEQRDTFNEVLNKPLHSKKLAKDSDEIAENEESPKTGGWKNKLVKPELTPLFSVGGSLFIVIAAFFLLVILFRKVSPQGNRPLPKEAFECLGKYFLTQKHQLQVLRLGSRIVLVSIMPDGISTLAEITDPDEAVSFLGLCRRLDTNSATEMFRNTVAKMSEDELSRPHDRPVVSTRRKGQSAASLDLYSDPDESLAAILARGRQH